MTTDTIADELVSALDARSIIEPFTSRDSSFGDAAAYAVSAELVRRRRTRGETPIGRKIGFTNRLIWDEYGVSSPLWGHVYDSTVTLLDKPDGRIPIGHLSQPRIEPEIVLHFRDVPNARMNEAQLLSTIDWIAHGFEIVQTHFLDWKFRLPDTIADFGLHGALIVGPPQPVERLGDGVQALQKFTIAMSRNGVLRGNGAGSNVLGSPLQAALHMLRVLSDQSLFESIRADEIVTTGTLTPALPIVAGETWTTSLSGIDLPGMRVHFD